MTATPLLAARDLAAGYRGVPPILEGVDVALAAGELVAVVGPNGAGKSTLLRTLAGQASPLAGRVEVLGRDLHALAPRERARLLGVVLPEKLAVGMIAARELVALGRHPHTGWAGTLGDRDRAVVAETLRRVGIAHLADRDVATLSDGERQKVMIARALAQEPTVLVLDEPTAFLDLPGRAEVIGLLRRLTRAGGDGAGELGAGGDSAGELGAGERRAGERRAAVLSTHDLDLALRGADRVWLVDGGRVVAGAPEDLVLRGVFAAAFASPAAAYDPETGSFRLAAEPQGTVTLRGEGLAARWTRRALERRGLRVLDRPAPGAPAVEVDDRGDAPRWRSEWGGETRAHRSIEDLLRALPRGGKFG